MITKALLIATRAHEGQTDRDGEAYILHPLAVGLMGRTDEERVVGFLHDVLEDTPVTADDLLNEGIHESCVNALKLLCHTKDTPYEEYLQNIIDSKNPVALRVKYHDLLHNYERGKKYPDLQAKHGKALQLIKPAVEAMETVSRFDYDEAEAKGHEVAIFAAGCFWGVQHYFQKRKGVVKSIVGYTGNTDETAENPTYELVRTHKTNHLEAVLVEFEPEQITYEELCKLFFEIHDPGQTDGQGPDKGQQYRSGVFYTNYEQLLITNKLVEYLRNHGHEVNTIIQPCGPFFIAEGYHQDYYENTGGSPYCHVRVRKFG